MSVTITRLFEEREDALAAGRDIGALGVHKDDISYLASSEDHHDGRDSGGDDHSIADTAAGGATTGAVVGGGAGVLAGLGLLAIPGLGPIVAAGWLAALAAGAAGGAAAGGVLGGLLGALEKAGVPKNEADVYAEGVRRGSMLLSVRVPDELAAEVANIMRRHNALDATMAGTRLRERGWTGS